LSTDIEDLLKDGLDRLTAGTRAPGGLARRVSQRHSRRRLAIGSTAAAGTAALSAAALVAASAGGGVTAGGPQPHHTTASGVSRPANAQAHTVADVIGHTERAIRTRNLIMVTTSPSTKVFSLEGSGKQKKIVQMSMVSYSYRNISRGVLTTITAPGQVAGQLHMEVGFVAGRRLPGQKRLYTRTTVNYGDKTWYRQQEKLPATGPAPVRLGCHLRQYFSRPQAPLRTYISNSPASFRAALACGGLKITGHRPVNGAPAIELTGTRRLTTFPLTVDVSPSTYLPLRLKFGHLEWDYRWLQPTAANLANLRVHAPAGFQRVAAP
jgi:hypothetical protein